MTEHTERIRNLQSKMADSGLDAFIVTQNVDLFYMTGSMQTGFGVVPSIGEPIFYVRRSVARAQEESAVRVEELGSLRSFGERLKREFPQIFAEGKTPVVATEFDVLPVQTFQRLESALPGVKWTDGSAVMRHVRMRKSEAELAAIREAACVVALGMREAAAQAREGMPEFELIAAVEHVVRRNGHIGLMRMRGYNQEIAVGMVAAGRTAAVPTYFDGPAGGQGLSAAFPQSASRRAIVKGEPILVDIGCCIDGYVIDQTRTMVIGELEPDLERAYEETERILREVEKRLKPGTIPQDLYALSLQMAEEAGLAKHFMGFGVDQVKFLGHGIGLEIDEWPVLARGFTEPLAQGMVIAVEPKFTFPDRGVVGIENTYVITENGYEKLTVSPEGLYHL